MGFYEKYVLPNLVHFVCGQKQTMKQREKIVPQATGRVLEIGIGSGLNIPYYDPEKVDHLWGIDPSAEMWAIARKNALEHHLDAEFIESGAEAIPLDDNTADTVVMTYTLCTIPDPRSALQEIRRVLKPGGNLLFCEHGEAYDKNVLRWQNRVNPLWRKMAGGCNLNRPVPGLLEDSGFTITGMETCYIPGWKPACFNYWGTASQA